MDLRCEKSQSEKNISLRLIKYKVYQMNRIFFYEYDKISLNKYNKAE